MTVLSEEKLTDYLSRVLTLSRDVLGQIPAEGTQPVRDDLLDRYLELINGLLEDRSIDQRLSDDSWNWIFENRPTANHIKLYGRLAWINLQLHELI